MKLLRITHCGAPGHKKQIRRFITSIRSKLPNDKIEVESKIIRETSKTLGSFEISMNDSIIWAQDKYKCNFNGSVDKQFMQVLEMVANKTLTLIKPEKKAKTMLEDEKTEDLDVDFYLDSYFDKETWNASKYVKTADSDVDSYLDSYFDEDTYRVLKYEDYNGLGSPTEE